MAFNLKNIFFAVQSIESLKAQYEEISFSKKEDPLGEKREQLLIDLLINQLNDLIVEQSLTQEGGIVKNFFKNVYTFQSKKIDVGGFPNIIRLLNYKLSQYNLWAERIPGNKDDLKVKPLR
jgi:hypothetical protein